LILSEQCNHFLHSAFFVDYDNILPQDLVTEKEMTEKLRKEIDELNKRNLKLKDFVNNLKPRIRDQKTELDAKQIEIEELQKKETSLGKISRS